MKWVGEENGPDGWGEGREYVEREAEEPGRPEVAPAASLDGTRPSEKAEVLEKA